MHRTDNLFYVVKLCFALHNAMVNCIEKGEKPKNETMYDQDNVEIEKLEIKNKDEKVKDDVYMELTEEDVFFQNNADRLDLESDNVDVELLAKYKHAQFLGQRLRLINMRWKKLSNSNDHKRLQNAIKSQLMKD